MSVLNGRLQTPQGAPASLQFNLPSSLISSTKNEVRISPYGASTINAGGRNIKFVIPKTDRAFINAGTMYFTGNVTIGGTLGTAGTDLYYVLGSYYSIFSRQTLSSNGRNLENIENPGNLVNMILNQTLNPAEKRAMADTYGFFNDLKVPGVAGGVASIAEMDTTYNICQPMNTDGAGSKVLPKSGGKLFSFALPVIGMLNLDSEKYLPLCNGDFELEYTVNDIKNWIVSNAAAGTTNITNSAVTFTLSNLELTPESNALVMASYPEKLYIKTQSYDFGSSIPLSVTSGSYDIPVNIKRSSLKLILFYFTSETLCDKTFGGVNPNLNDYVFITNGTQYPQRPVRVANNPSEAFNQVQKAWGSLYSNNHSGSCGVLDFRRRSKADTHYYPALTEVGDILIGSNKFYLAIDCEVINHNTPSLYSGIPMGVNSNFRINIAEATDDPTSITPYYWLVYDSVVEMDLINGITSVIA